MITAIIATRTFVVIRARSHHAGNRSSTGDGIIVGAGPIELQGTSDRAMLLLHGFNDTPQSVAHLAHALHAAGWTVSVPLLPHHGRAPEIFARDGNADEWLAEARVAWQSVRERSARPVLAGQSMGGAIALILAAEIPPAAVVLLAPYIAMSPLARALSSVWPLWALAVPILRSDPQRGFRDAAARKAHLGGYRFTPRLVAQLRRVVQKARKALADVRAPTLVIHARTDYRIPSASALRAFSSLGASDKTLIWREDTGHVLAADGGREHVATVVAEWLDQRIPREGGVD
jgi:carboxylesterase